MIDKQGPISKGAPSSVSVDGSAVPVDAMVSIDTFVQLFRLQTFCVIADVHHA
jgi:hypothetical protein